VMTCDIDNDVEGRNQVLGTRCELSAFEYI